MDVSTTTYRRCTMIKQSFNECDRVRVCDPSSSCHNYVGTVVTRADYSHVQVRVQFTYFQKLFWPQQLKLERRATDEERHERWTLVEQESK